MMGPDHGWTGAAVFAAIAPTLPAAGPALAFGITVCAGAAVLPDIDHPDSTVSRQFGFLTESLAWVVNKLSGGHRHGTHSLLGVTVVTAGAWFAGAWQATAPTRHGMPVPSWHLLPAGLFLALIYAAAVRALLGQVFLRHLRLARFTGHHADAAGIIAALATLQWGGDLTEVTRWHVPLLAVAVAVGCLSHLAGDMCTHGGCPLLWPFGLVEFHLLSHRLQITTNKLAEHWIVSPLLLTVFTWVLITRDTASPAAIHATRTAIGGR